jgi:AcrR family transcriptional regulator
MAQQGTFLRAYYPQHEEQRATGLVGAARTLAARDGVRGVTLTAIATQAGVHVSAVRRYFDSREEILLGLAEEGYADWTRALIDRVHGHEGLTSADLAHAVTETLVERPLFCDLLTHVSLNLEREVTYERVRASKFTVVATLAPLREAITRASALTAEQANNLIIAVISMTAPLWQAAQPAETLTRLYAEEPSLAHIGIDFAPTLTRLLSALCDGMTRGPGNTVAADPSVP